MIFFWWIAQGFLQVYCTPVLYIFTCTHTYHIHACDYVQECVLNVLSVHNEDSIWRVCAPTNCNTSRSDDGFKPPVVAPGRARSPRTLLPLDSERFKHRSILLVESEERSVVAKCCKVHSEIFWMSFLFDLFDLFGIVDKANCATQWLFHFAIAKLEGQYATSGRRRSGFPNHMGWPACEQMHGTVRASFCNWGKGDFTEDRKVTQKLPR